MDSAHLHLMLNHFPLFALVIGVPIVLYGAIRNSQAMVNTGLIIFLAAAVVAVPTYLTGEPAEDIVENLPGVSEAFIESHEDAAKIALGFAVVTGIASAVGLAIWFFKPAIQRYAATPALLLAVVTLGLMGWTANLGGQIRHTEIRAGDAAATQSEPKRPEKNDDDH
ncbi:MAG: hypothetical protein KF762_04490 [Acidobacteria bacterium]|nr:hypothetical protein [Acidobacteriota bacterium]